jgi:hypothetical protein
MSECPFSPKAPDIPIPRQMQGLPTARGFVVPWFVRWYGGQPEFRVMDAFKFEQAIKQGLCWVCGGKLMGAGRCFVIGPMCAVNRVASEPPSHPDCARYSARACPFLSRPYATRRHLAEDPATGKSLDTMPTAGGIMIERNPGVTLLWFTSSYKLVRVPNGFIFRIGKPVGVEWYCEGREATREEVMESINSGLPVVRDYAAIDGPEAEAQIQRDLDRALRLVPA